MNSTTKKDVEDNTWHFDKRVPISILLVLVFQGASGLWVIADMRKDIEIVKIQVSVQHERDAQQDRQIVDFNNAQIKAQTDRDVLVIGRLDRIETKVDRNLENSHMLAWPKNPR